MSDDEVTGKSLAIMLVICLAFIAGTTLGIIFIPSIGGKILFGIPMGFISLVTIGWLYQDYKKYKNQDYE